MSLSILLTLIVTAIATSVLGVYLVLRKMSMLVDAISHTVLLGIVIAFMFVGDLSSPLLIVGATIMGLITVFLTETLVKTKKTSEDAATGLIFPLLFSIAIIIISTNFKGVHLDIDAVLLGKIEFIPFDLLYINGVAIGPKLLYIMLVVMIINLVFVKIFFKELKIISFDTALAATLGFMPFLVHYLLMALVSLTAVSAFNAVGTILVVALMIGPAASAVIITKDLKYTLVFSIFIGIINVVIGYLFALIFNVNTAGMIATITLITFFLIVIFEPRNGMIVEILRKKKLKKDFEFLILIFHLFNHDQIIHEVHYELIKYELNWSDTKVVKQVEFGMKKGYIRSNDNILSLTDLGLDFYYLSIKELSIN